MDKELENMFITLNREKLAIENEISALERSISGTWNAPLVDEQGFPCESIEDIPGAVRARQRIRMLSNDHNRIMKRLEDIVPRLLSERKVDHPMDNSPFAVVKDVCPDSPAETAGLQKGDLVIRFGQVSAQSMSSWTDVQLETNRHENQPFSIVVLREEKTVHLTLCPQRWSGPGLLGCHLVRAK